MIWPAATPLARFKKAMTLAPNPHAITRDDVKQRRRLATGPFRHPNPSQIGDQSILDPDQLFLLDLRGLRDRLGSQLEGIGENLHAELEEPRIVDAGLIARPGPGTLVRAGNPRHAVDHSVEVLVQQLERTIDDPRQLVVGSFGGMPGDELSLERRQSILIALAVKPPRKLKIRRRNPLRGMRMEPGYGKPGRRQIEVGSAELGIPVLFLGAILPGNQGPARLDRQTGKPAGDKIAPRQIGRAGTPPQSGSHQREDHSRQQQRPGPVKPARDQGKRARGGRGGQCHAAARSSLGGLIDPGQRDRVLIADRAESCLQRGPDLGQIGQHLGCRLVTVRRALGHQLEHQTLELERDVWPAHAQADRLLADMFQRQRDGGIGLEWRLSAQHVIERDAQRVEIATVVQGLSLGLLRTHVQWRAHRRARLRDMKPARPQVAAEPEVRNLRPPLARQEQVLGLDVRWTSPTSPAAPIAWPAWRMIDSASGSSSAPFLLMYSRRFVPSTYSIAMKRTPST